MKCSRMLKKVLHPMAANLLQNRHMVRFGADMAMANPNDQITSVIVNAKKRRLVIDPGFE